MHERTSPSQAVRGYAVHVYTASGILLAFLAALEIAAPAPDPRSVLLLLAGAVLIDATDGPLARRWHVKRWAPAVDGRTIDDIVDYITYSFLPLLLVGRMGWVPDPTWAWIGPALVASLFGFAHVGAKDEEAGFFRGFPSYWNVVAFYAGIAYTAHGPVPNAILVSALALLTVTPVRFVYPNLAPPPWRVPLILGALLWLVLLLAMLPVYPHPPEWLVWLSLAYPVLYAGASWRLARRSP